MAASPDVTRLLEELTHGDRGALDRVVPLVYDELRAIAHRQLRVERVDHTLNTTALVNEAYLKLVGIERVAWKGRSHFFAIAARAMRRILVDHAVAAKAAKRGGGAVAVTLERVPIADGGDVIGVLEVDDALTRLGEVNARYVSVVECRFFGGMSLEETAEALGVSLATVKRDWTFARAWLNRELAA